MRRISILTGVLASLALGATQSAHAQSFGDRLRKRAEEAAKRKVEQRVDQRSGEATDAAMNSAEGTVKCAASDRKCIDKAKREGKQVETPGAGSEASSGAAAGGASPRSLKPGEGAWVNYDFVPGTRALFVDDFTKDNVGDFPRRLEFKDGNMEVAEWQGGRYLRVTSWPGRFAIDLPEQLPERFTLEFDAIPGVANNWMVIKFADNAPDDVRFRYISGKGEGGVFGPEHQTQGRTSGPASQESSFRGRVMADGKYVKVYMNDTRVANIPNADLGRTKKIVFEIPGKEDEPGFLTNLSVMAGGKKLYDALAEKGRVSTQGIYFDTGSDRIRPESSPTLKEIGAMMAEHADLKLTIEGHTDNAGAAAANQALSEKRAAAVKAVLVSGYGVSADRLVARGFGASKPAGSNDTPEGRQTNRRVELVKM